MTSAFTGEGLEPLVERIRSAIPWDRQAGDGDDGDVQAHQRPRPLAPGTHRLAGSSCRRESSGSVLRARPWNLAPFSDAEMLTAVGHLSNHGYVSRLTTSSGETRILLAPELLNNVAASIVLQARRNPRNALGRAGRGAVARQRSWFPGARRSRTVADRDVLLDSAVAMFLAHNVCFRDTDASASRARI